MRYSTKSKISGMLLFCSVWVICGIVALPILYSIVISNEGLSGMFLTTVPLAFGLEWSLSPVLTASLLMISGGE